MGSWQGTLGHELGITTAVTFGVSQSECIVFVRCEHVAQWVSAGIYGSRHWAHKLLTFEVEWLHTIPFLFSQLIFIVMLILFILPQVTRLCCLLC